MLRIGLACHSGGHVPAIRVPRLLTQFTFNVLRPALVAATCLLFPAGYALGQSGLPSGMDIGRQAAEQTGEWVDDKIKQRFPDPNSPVRWVSDKLVKKHPDLAQKLGQSALNPDRYPWSTTSREVLREYAKRELEEQQKKGIDIWKDMGRQIINPSGSLSKVGLDPVDLYAQGVRDWSDFVEKSRTRFHGAVLDCFYDKYRGAIADGAEAADDQVLTAGTAGNRCGGEKPRDSFAAQISGFIKRMTGGFSTSAEFELPHDELMKLLKEFHEKNGGKPGATFSDWVKDRFNENLQARQKQVRAAIDGVRAAIDGDQAQARKQPAAAPGPAKPAPGDDPALVGRVENALALLKSLTVSLEQEIVFGKEQCQRIGEALKPDGTDSIPNRVKAIEDMIDRAAAGRKQVGADKVLYEDFRSAKRIMERTAGLADDAARDACTRSRAADPDLAAIRAGADKTGTLGVLVGQVASTARDAADKLLPRLAAPGIAQTGAQTPKAVEGLNELGKLCASLLQQQPVSKARALLERMQGPGRDVTVALSEGAGGKLSPETAAAYRARFDNHISEVAALAPRVDSCSRDIDSVTDACRSGHQKLFERLTVIDMARDDLSADREAMARQVRFDRQNLQDLINQAEAARERAAQCLSDAQQKKPAIDPALLGEADDLGDPSKATCKSLRSRATQLRDARFSAVPGRAGKIAELERLADIYDTAKGHFDRAKAAYENADTDQSFAELQMAEDQIKLMPGKVDCKSATDAIANGRKETTELVAALQRIHETLHQCSADTLRAHIAAIDEKSRLPGVIAFKSKMQEELAAIKMFSDANAAYKDGDVERAGTLLAEAEKSLSGVAAGDCSSLRRQVSGLGSSVTAATKLLATCAANDIVDKDGVMRLGYVVPDGDYTAATPLRRRLESRLENCEQDKSGPKGKVVTVGPPPPKVPLPPLTGPSPPVGPTTVTGPSPPVGPPGGTGPPRVATPPDVAGLTPEGSPRQAEDKPAGSKSAGTECDPAKVAKSKPALSEGFVAVPYSGATAVTGEYNPDCSPYGPVAKRSDDGLMKTETRPPVYATAEACNATDAALQRGRQHYLAGRVAEYRVALVNAERTLDRLKDSKACAGQRVKIAEASGQADLLEKVIRSTDQALADCRPQQLQKLSGLLGKTNHPYVVQLRGRIDRMATVAAKVDAADARLRDGDKTRAATLYREAAAGLNAGAGACDSLAQRVRHGQERIQTASLAPKPEMTELAKAENHCKSRLGARAVAVPDPDSLTGFTCDCADPYILEVFACVPQKSATELAEAAHNVCRDQFGSAAYAQPNSPDFKDYGCLCGKGHVWNDNRTQCVQQTREQVMADANRRCQEANKDRRARAEKYLGNDQWSCVIERSQAEVIADAHRSCQQANHNSRARAVKYLGNGQWSCTIPSRRRTRHQAQPDYAASAAAAAAIIQGLGAIMQHRIARPPQHRAGGGGYHLPRNPDTCIFNGRRVC